MNAFEFALSLPKTYQVTLQFLVCSSAGSSMRSRLNWAAFKQKMFEMFFVVSR